MATQIINLVTVVAGLAIILYFLWKVYQTSDILKDELYKTKEQTNNGLINVQKKLDQISELAKKNKEMYENYLIPVYRDTITDNEIENLPVPGTSLAMVSFNDFLDSANIEIRRKQELKNADIIIRKMLRYAGVTNLPGSGTQLVTAIKNLANTSEYSVVFSEHAKQMLKSGELRLMAKKGTNLFKAVLVSNDSDKVTNLVDLAKKTKGAMTTEILSNAATAVIAIAHIISNYDMSVKIKEINKKLDYLIEGRLIDKKARLKAIFYHINHVMHLDEKQRETQLCLMHRELMELRFNWAMEIEQELEDITDERVFFVKWLGLGKERQDNKNKDKVCSLEQKMLLIDGSYKIDSLVCGMTGINVNVEHELEGIRRIKSVLNEKYKEFKTPNVVIKTQEEMNYFFDMLESDCRTVFGNLNKSVENAEFSEI